MPISPAPPKSSAHSDQTVAAMTPSATRVSMVDEPCRPARHAARWNGQAPHVTTGSASTATTHCQPSNCSAGIIDSATTGTARTAETRSRRSRSCPRSGVGAEVSSPSTMTWPGAMEWPESAISSSVMPGMSWAMPSCDMPSCDMPSWLMPSCPAESGAAPCLPVTRASYPALRTAASSSSSDVADPGSRTT